MNPRTPTFETIRQALACEDPGCACHKPNGHVHCPAHEDTTPSLAVTEKASKILFKCFGGCSQDRVTSALKVRDLWPSPSGDRPQAQKPRIVAIYDYLDAAGNLVYQVMRREPKDFRQRRPDPQHPGKWIWSMDGVDRVPYRLPELLEAEVVAVGRGRRIATGCGPWA